MPERINEEVFIAMAKALDFIDPGKDECMDTQLLWSAIKLLRSTDISASTSPFEQYHTYLTQHHRQAFNDCRLDSHEPFPERRQRSSNGFPRRQPT